jgi:Icc-related predicted phosphoesterase
MVETRKIMVIGDTHGDWPFLNELISKRKPEVVLSCGDFGWWPKFHDSYSLCPPYGVKKKKWELFGAIKNHDCKIHFAPGNHEDWNDLDEHEKSSQLELMPNVFYMPKGSVVTLPDGRNVLFFGGAESIDKAYRIEGVDWFRQEVATYADLYLLDKITCKIDIVISHTAPDKFTAFDATMPERIGDPTRQILDYILDHFKPSLWYFGHFHRPAKERIGDCLLTAMNMTRESNCWAWID